MGGYLKTRGTDIVDEEGNVVLLRGMGIGNWLLPEGYMWCLPQAADRPRRIEGLVRDLIGERQAKGFWESYYDRFVTEDDVASIAADGMNSIRLPINSRSILSTSGPELLDESRMARIDRLLSWCRAHGVYVILDLHGAPGGQTGTNIDDSEHDLPELFTNRENARLTVEIWRALASRYADEWIVAGYDLLNEPLPEWFARYNDLLLPLYRDIINAIRSVDTRHMVILEGAHWATDWSVFTEKPDDNLMLEFHKYWNNPDRESLAPYLERREEWHVPIFMGEGGENNTDWYAGAFRLFEDLRISWNFWTWKKLDTTNSPLSIRRPHNWSAIVEYAENGTPLERADAVSIFNEYLENVSSERCTRNPQVVRSLFRRPNVRVPAVFYAYGEAGSAFFTPEPTSYEPSFRSRDRMPMVFARSKREIGSVTSNFQHGEGQPWAVDEWIALRLQAGTWVAFDFDASRLPAPRRTSGGDGGPGNDSHAHPCSVTLSVEPDQRCEITLTVDDPGSEHHVSAGPGIQRLTACVEVIPGIRRIIVGVDQGTCLLTAIELGVVAEEV